MNDLTEKVRQIKIHCLDMCVKAGTGHITTAFSCAEIVTVLYYRILRINPTNPNWDNRDRFIMSKNHGSIITYPILEDLGFFKGEADHFLQDGCLLGTHSDTIIPGVDFTGGSLAIGLGVACGMAYSAKMDRKEWLTFALVGDGECYEGAIWEAAMFAGHNQLNNLIVIIDKNGIGATDFTKNLLNQEPFADKWTAFNWEVRTIDGHNLSEIVRSLEDVRTRTDKKPLCIIANTVKGFGVDFMESNVFMHNVVPKGDKADIARQQLLKTTN